MEKVRVQFDLSPHRVAELDALMEACGVETRKDLFNNALTILEWSVQEVMRGNSIASINEEQHAYRVLQMPVLNHAARRPSAYYGAAG